MGHTQKPCPEQFSNEHQQRQNATWTRPHIVTLQGLPGLHALVLVQVTTGPVHLHPLELSKDSKGSDSTAITATGGQHGLPSALGTLATVGDTPTQGWATSAKAGDTVWISNTQKQSMQKREARVECEHREPARGGVISRQQLHTCNTRPVASQHPLQPAQACARLTPPHSSAQLSVLSGTNPRTTMPG